ncbi:MAG TPA: hypothetical protein VEI05_00740 [Burkholderiaceae bacterium]|nr:hypothetical protein [Burkholderiaceae bacterium]
MRPRNWLLALIAPLAIALWTPSAQAIPAFARQLGVACDTCHYQRFPVLNAFGRAFKESGFTMIGSEGQLESPTGMLSLPVNLNAAIELYSSYIKTNGPTGTAANETNTTKTTNSGDWQIPSSSSVFFGGRVGEHIGFEAELAIYPTPAGLLNVKLPFVYDVGPVKAGAVLFSTSVYGPSFGLEVMNTGANAVHLFNQQNLPLLSAQQYLNTGTPARGLDFIASNEYFFAVAGLWGADDNNAPPTNTGNLSSNYLRVVGFPHLIPNMDFGIGAQLWSGRSNSTGNVPGTVMNSPGAFIPNPVAVPPTPQPQAGQFDTKAWAVDAQLLGNLYDLPFIVITSYALAPSSGAPSGIPEGFQGNLFNPGTASRYSFNVGMEQTIVRNLVTAQVAGRWAHSGFALGPTSNATDNAWMLAATYSFALNVRAELSYSKYYGDLYNTLSQQIQGPAYLGNSMWNFTLVAAF